MIIEKLNPLLKISNLISIWEVLDDGLLEVIKLHYFIITFQIDEVASSFSLVFFFS
jgi:hypothetical protein